MINLINIMKILLIKGESGVSSVLSSLLVVVITIVIFAAAFTYIQGLIPSISPSYQSNFRVEVIYQSTSGSGPFKLNITNLYGENLPTNFIEFNIVVINGKNIISKSHLLFEIIKKQFFDVGTNMTYDSSMDGINVPISYASKTIILISFVDIRSHTTLWYSQISGLYQASSLKLASLSPVNVTVGAPITLYAIASGGDPPYSYSWSYSGPGQAWITEPNNQTTLFYPSVPGIYTITLSVTDSFNASDSSDGCGSISYGGSVGPNTISVSRTVNVTQSSSNTVIPFNIKLSNYFANNKKIKVEKYSTDPTGNVEVNYTASYPTLTVSCQPNVTLPSGTWDTDYSDQPVGYVWYLGGAEIPGTEGLDSIQFVPSFSAANYTVYNITVYYVYAIFETVTIFNADGTTSEYTSFVGYEYVYVDTFILNVYPALNATIGERPSQVGLVNTTFYVTFNQPLQNANVELSIPQLYVNSTPMYPVPGSQGFTYFTSVFLPYTQLQQLNGYVEVYVNVSEPSGNFEFSQPIHYILNT